MPDAPKLSTPKPNSFDEGVKQAASKATGISRGTKPSFAEKALEFVTGVPLDPDFYRNSSRQEIFMNTVPQLAMGALGMSRLPGPKGSPVKGAIKADPYGLSDAPMDRRVFADRISNGRAKRFDDLHGQMQKEQVPYEHYEQVRDAIDNKLGDVNTVTRPDIAREERRYAKYRDSFRGPWNSMLRQVAKRIAPNSKLPDFHPDDLLGNLKDKFFGQ